METSYARGTTLGMPQKLASLLTPVDTSHTILRYLSLKFNVADHWYPRSDLLKRTKIDTYLDWYRMTSTWDS